VSIPISGEKITEDIASSLEIKKEQAEKAKIICGLKEDEAGGIISKVLAGTINDLNDKIREVLEFHNNHFSQYGNISKITICGGGANIKGIDKIISKATSIETVRGDALVNLGEAKEKFLHLLSETYSLDSDFSKNKKIDGKNNISVSQDSSLTFATAIGLALRGIFIDKI
jgi:Tfp pilus assembly PilM family ATPase